MPSRHSIAILCHASAGGSGVVATELALSLIELGHNVHLIATERPFRLTEDRLAIASQRPRTLVVDAERFKPSPEPELRRQFAQPEEAIVLHASNFRPVKRTEDATRVFAGIAKQGPARMLMLGSGPERPKAIMLAQELGVFGRIQFLEFTPAPEQLMSVADLLLLPSQTESFGLVALEAMASGAVVIASRVGGIPEVVLEGETGYLCPVGDIAAMTEAALQVLDNPERRNQMGRAARQRATEHFNPQKILPQYLSVYQAALLSDVEMPLEKVWG